MREWLVTIITKYGARLGQWERAQLQVAAAVLGEDRFQPAQPDASYCVVRAAVNPSRVALTPPDAQTIVAAVLDNAGNVDPIAAAFLLAAMHRGKAAVVASIRADVLSVDDVLSLLRGVPRALQEWTWEDKPRTKFK